MLRGESLVKFEKKLKDNSPPTPTSTRSAMVIDFIKTAQKIRIPSMGGFAGLNRAEIEVSFKYSDLDTIALEDIWWAIEYLDDKLRNYFNTKEDK